MSRGPHHGWADFIRAATPATCGDAIDVPLILAVAAAGSVDRMELPGAATSILFRPKLEKLLFTPAWVVLATVITPGSSVGMSRQLLLIVRVTGVESFGLLLSVVLLARS